MNRHEQILVDINSFYSEIFFFFFIMTVVPNLMQRQTLKDSLEFAELKKPSPAGPLKFIFILFYAFFISDLRTVFFAFASTRKI